MTFVQGSMTIDHLGSFEDQKNHLGKPCVKMQISRLFLKKFLFGKLGVARRISIFNKCLVVSEYI